MNWTNMLELN